MKKLLFLGQSIDGTDYEKIRAFDYTDQIEVYDRKLNQVVSISVSDLNQYNHKPIIDGVEYKVLFLIVDSEKVIDSYLKQLKLRDECHTCYYHEHSICPVNIPETMMVGNVQITSMFIKNEQPRREICDHFRSNKKRIPCKALIDKVRAWLNVLGKEFFTEVKEKYGRIDACWSENGIPHAVHFREGMQVRNFMRSTGLCLDWDSIDYDDNWVETVEKALNI